MSTAELLKKTNTENILNVGGKENQRKQQRDGLMTERARAGTLSPSNPESDRRASGNLNKALI
jgi:hypothetical protein